MKNINILVVGKSGVGKSSLLNYLADKDVYKTGVGSPVTQEYFENYVYIDKSKDVAYNLFDTKGIEPGETNTFVEIIENKIDEFEKHESIFDKLHTVFYCFSAPSKRIEPFEIEFIKRLKEIIPVVIILTKCDLVDAVSINNLKSYVEKNVGSTHTIQVCSVEQRTRRGTTSPFGRDQVLKHSFIGIWDKLNYELNELLGYYLREETKIEIGQNETVAIGIGFVIKSFSYYSDRTTWNLWDLFNLPTLSELGVYDLYQEDLPIFVKLLNIIKRLVLNISVDASISEAIKMYISEKNTLVDELLQFYTSLTSLRITKKPYFSSDDKLNKLVELADEMKDEILTFMEELNSHYECVKSNNTLIDWVFSVDGRDELRYEYSELLNNLDEFEEAFYEVLNDFSVRLDSELKQYHRLILQIDDEVELDSIYTEDDLTDSEMIYYHLVNECFNECDSLTEHEFIFEKLQNILSISKRRADLIKTFIRQQHIKSNSWKTVLSLEN